MLLGRPRRFRAEQSWSLGYLDTGADDVIFPDAPMVTSYAVAAGSGMPHRVTIRPSAVVMSSLVSEGRTFVLSLVFDGETTAGMYLVHGDASTVLARIARHWTTTSFVASGADSEVLCTVDRGGLIFMTWVAITANDQPLLVFRSKINGGRISFADGRSARLKRRILSQQWSIVDDEHAVLATGNRVGSRWQLVWGELAVRVDDHGSPFLK